MINIEAQILVINIIIIFAPESMTHLSCSSSVTDRAWGGDSDLLNTCYLLGNVWAVHITLLNSQRDSAPLVLLCI